MATDIAEEKIISDPSTVAVLFHEKKQLLLALLIQNEMNIIELKNATKMNPGTVKRHINDLLDHGLVQQTRLEKNMYSITEKYYRATAKTFIIQLRWP